MCKPSTIIENGGAVHIADAVGAQEELDRVVGQADLSDVLTVAVLASTFIDDPDVDIELNNEKFCHIMHDCVEEISALRSALGT